MDTLKHLPPSTQCTANPEDFRKLRQVEHITFSAVRLFTVAVGFDNQDFLIRAGLFMLFTSLIVPSSCSSLSNTIAMGQ